MIKDKNKKKNTNTENKDKNKNKNNTKKKNAESAWNFFRIALLLESCRDWVIQLSNGFKSL